MKPGTEPHETRSLDRRIDVERAGQVERLVGDDADRPAAQARKADDDVPREMPVDFEEDPVVGDRVNQIEHVVRLVRGVRYQPIERHVLSVDGIGGLETGRIVEVVAWEVAEELADEREARAVIRHGKVGDAARGVVGHRAAELVLGHLLVGHRLDDVRAGHEHVARAFDHDGEVGDGWRVHGPARARSHDGRDLRDRAGSQGVAQEDVGVAGERSHAFLDARTARIVEPHHGHALPERQIHDLHDLRRVGFRE
jgi:hypothetical protein